MNCRRLRPGLFLTFLLVLLVSTVGAQGRFTVNGRLKIEGGDLSSARAVVYKDGVKERSINSGLNKFSLDLELGHSYVISFEKDGFVAKKISFNTQAPTEAAANGFTPFDFAVSLFKQYDDINLVVFNQPVGMIRYDDKTGDFDYDTDYTKSIQSQLQQVLAQVEVKQKEEQANAKANEEKVQEETKARAKAEAEAAKQQAAQAKADAEARKQAEASAKAAEKKAAEEKKAELAKVKEQPPPPVEKPTPPPARAEKPPPPPPLQRNELASKAIAGEDGRRSQQVIVREEGTRVAQATVVAGQDERPASTDPEPFFDVAQETLVEPSRVTTIVKVTTLAGTDEFRKVIHKWGGVYYFRNGGTCTQEVFERSTRSEALAGTTARGKMD